MMHFTHIFACTLPVIIIDFTIALHGLSTSNLIPEVLTIVLSPGDGLDQVGTSKIGLKLVTCHTVLHLHQYITSDNT